MRPNRLLAIGLAALVVTTGGALALPGNAPSPAPADGAGDGPHANASADSPADDRANSSAGRHGSAAPPVELPAEVPDFVSEVHRTIADHGDGLGQAIRDLTPEDASPA